jgi:AraC-like DNA-binding protein
MFSALRTIKDQIKDILMEQINKDLSIFSKFTRLPIQIADCTGDTLFPDLSRSGFPYPVSLPVPEDPSGTLESIFFQRFIFIRQSSVQCFLAGPYILDTMSPEELADNVCANILPYRARPDEQKSILTYFLSLPVISKAQEANSLTLLESIFRKYSIEQEQSVNATETNFFHIIERSVANRRIKQLPAYDYFSVKEELKNAMLDGPSQILAEYLLRTFEYNIPDLSGDTLRVRKNLTCTFLSAIAKTAIELGLDVIRAFTINDMFLVYIENARSEEELNDLIFDAICRYSQELKFHKPKIYNKYVRFCMTYISNNLSRPVKLAEIAEKLEISTEHLSRVFATEVGKSFSEYMMEYRMTEARRLILFSKETCGTIGLLTGFSSESHFSKAFSKYWGITPQKLRLWEGRIK